MFMRLLTGPFREAIYIIDTIERAGHQAYFVGGCVRDSLLNRTIGDVDITTSAKPNEIQTIFNEVIPVGIEHGTVIVRHNQVSYEVTTFRTEGDYSDHRHPDSVSFIDRIDEDLARRDFTINALAMDKNGELIDLFHGQEDLKKSLIRTVGNGYERFTEDPLRILRAARFTSQLGFEIEKHTQEAITAAKASIEGLAVERITVELEKLFAGTYVKRSLEYMHELGIEQHLPVLKNVPIISRLTHTIQPLETIAEVICLIHQIDPSSEIQQMVKEWKCSNQVLRKAKTLCDAIDYYKASGLDKWLAYQLLPVNHDAFARVIEVLSPGELNKNELLSLRDKLAITSKKELAINGNDIIDLFPTVQKGPWIQSLIVKLEKLVVDGKIHNEKSILKDWIKWNPPEVK
jgi:tRNA nucleotidyltransferase (CCA-adding enzyme)